MRGILVIGLLAMIIFLIAVIIMIAGGSEKSRRTIVTIISCLVISLVLGSYSIYQFMSEMQNDFSDTHSGKSGTEIYEYYYGKPRHNCLEIIDQADYQSFAGGDWLHFKTCPEEFSRIIRQYRFRVHRDTTDSVWVDTPSPEADWFRPHVLGTDRLKLEFPVDPRPRLVLYSSSDSTEVYMVSYN